MQAAFSGGGAVGMAEAVAAAQRQRNGAGGAKQRGAHAAPTRETWLDHHARPAQKHALFLAARTLNATGQSRVTLSLR